MRFGILIFVFLFAPSANAQTLTREFTVAPNLRVAVENPVGQVRVIAIENSSEIENQSTKLNDKAFLEASSPAGAVAKQELVISAAADSIEIRVAPTAKRIDLILRVPERSRLKIIGANAAIEILGNFEAAAAATDTGTIYANVPTDDLKYNFLWTERRPLFFSETALADAKEKASGKFTISGRLPAKSPKSVEAVQSPKSKVQSPKSGNANRNSTDSAAESETQTATINNQQSTINNRQSNRVTLDFTTKRGLILFNVPPSEVPSDLRDRPLTKAAKAVVRSNDSVLSEAIRKVSPKRFEEFVRSLPPRRAAPNLTVRTNNNSAAIDETETVRRVNASVTDDAGRAVANLTQNDFAVFENGAPAEVISVEATNAPFNLVLLLDVSGSVEERVDFIRKAARNFINTVSPNDKLAVITFRDDVQVISNFSQDKRYLSASLDTFEAGGATALYDALGFVLAETLQPLRGERTAVVILSDGDDNRSFLPLEPLLGAIEESGTLVYPLYLPSGLAASADAQTNSLKNADPLRARFFTVTSKAEADAQKLAAASGGAYFPIRRLEDLQKAYEDVAKQLRTAYSITFRSKFAAPPRLRVTVKQPGASVRVGSITELKQLGAY